MLFPCRKYVAKVTEERVRVCECVCEREREREAEIPPEYQDCHCRHKAQCSTLHVSIAPAQFQPMFDACYRSEAPSANALNVKTILFLPLFADVTRCRTVWAVIHLLLFCAIFISPLVPSWALFLRNFVSTFSADCLPPDCIHLFTSAHLHPLSPSVHLSPLILSLCLSNSDLLDWHGLN